MATLQGFTRLKGLFSSSINYVTYKNIVASAKNAECGNIPKDLLGIILGKGSACTKHAEIDAVKEAFECASDTLSHGISVTKRAQSIQLHKELGSTFSKEKIISLDFLRELDLKKLESLSTVITRGVDKASLELTEHFSKIIPNCARVEVKPLGAGAFGQGYKLEFFDANGNKIIHDKVLKVFYKDGETGTESVKKVLPLLMEKQKEFTLRDIVTMWNNLKKVTVEDVITFLKPYEEQLSKQGITIKPEDIETGLTKLRSVKLKDIKPFFSLMKDSSQSTQMLDKMFEGMQQVHGASAEANTMMYLRNRLGHTLNKTNVIAPDYYNLRKGFSIAECSDDLLPKSISDVDFGLLGLMHGDLHDANKVADRIIDLGGVRFINPQLSDKITLRYYKKIMNQKNPELRQQYIVRLKKEIESMNQLDREKVQRAIDLAA